MAGGKCPAEMYSYSFNYTTLPGLRETGIDHRDGPVLSPLNGEFGGGNMPFEMLKADMKSSEELEAMFSGHMLAEQRPPGKSREELDRLFREFVAHLRIVLNDPLIGKTPNTPREYKIMEESQFVLNRFALENLRRWHGNPAEYQFKLFFRLLENPPRVKAEKPFYKRVKNMSFSSSKIRARW